MNFKEAIFIKEFIEKWFTVKIYGPRCSLVNAIDFIIQYSRIMHDASISRDNNWIVIL